MKKKLGLGFSTAGSHVVSRH